MGNDIIACFLIRISIILPSDKIDLIDANEADESQILGISEDEGNTRSQPDSECGSSNVQFYKCPFCPKTEPYYSNLKNHVAKAHFAKEMSIDKSQKQCYFCGKSFTTRNNLVNIKMLTLESRCLLVVGKGVLVSRTQPNCLIR